MKKLGLLAGFALIMLLAAPLTAEARGRFVFSFGVGGPVYVPYAYYPPYPAYYYAPYPAYYAPYYYYPGPVVRYYGGYHGPRMYRGGYGYYRHVPPGHAYGRYAPRGRGRR